MMEMRPHHFYRNVADLLVAYDVGCRWRLVRPYYCVVNKPFDEREQFTWWLDIVTQRECTAQLLIPYVL